MVTHHGSTQYSARARKNHSAEYVATSEECQSERNRIGCEMAAAYPYERDYVIACRLNLKHSSYERLKKGRVNVVEAKNEDGDLPTCDLMRSSKRHNQLLKGRSNHAIPLADESLKQRLPTPLFRPFYRPSYFSEIGLPARLQRTLMIGHLLLTSFGSNVVEWKAPKDGRCYLVVCTCEGF